MDANLIPVSFGNLLRYYRTRASKSQDALAKPLDFNASYISHLENDARRPSRHVVMQLSQALELTDVERDELLSTAGHLPEGDRQRMLAAVGANSLHPVALTVSAALQDARLDAHSREKLAEEVEAYVLFRLSQLKGKGE